MKKGNRLKRSLALLVVAGVTLTGLVDLPEQAANAAVADPTRLAGSSQFYKVDPYPQKYQWGAYVAQPGGRFALFDTGRPDSREEAFLGAEQTRYGDTWTIPSWGETNGKIVLTSGQGKGSCILTLSSWAGTGEGDATWGSCSDKRAPRWRRASLEDGLGSWTLVSDVQGYTLALWPGGEPTRLLALGRFFDKEENDSHWKLRWGAISFRGDGNENGQPDVWSVERKSSQTSVPFGSELDFWVGLQKNGVRVGKDQPVTIRVSRVAGTHNLAYLGSNTVLPVDGNGGTNVSVLTGATLTADADIAAKKFKALSNEHSKYKFEIFVDTPKPDGSNRVSDFEQFVEFNPPTTGSQGGVNGGTQAGVNGGTQGGANAAASAAASANADAKGNAGAVAAAVGAADANGGKVASAAANNDASAAAQSAGNAQASQNASQNTGSAAQGAAQGAKDGTDSTYANASATAAGTANPKGAASSAASANASSGASADAGSGGTTQAGVNGGTQGGMNAAASAGASASADAKGNAAAVAAAAGAADANGGKVASAAANNDASAAAQSAGNAQASQNASQNTGSAAQGAAEGAANGTDSSFANASATAAGSANPKGAASSAASANASSGASGNAGSGGTTQASTNANSAATGLSMPLFSTSTLPAGTVGTAYSATMKVSGTPVPSFSVSGGKLPGGLKFDAKTGKISGTPTKAGAFTFTVKLTNSKGTVSRSFSIKVGAAKVKTDSSPCAVSRKAAVFADTPLGHKFYKEIDWMECMKYSTGWRQPAGKPLYKPADNLQRQAMAAFIYRMEAPKGYKAPAVSPFADVKPTDSFYKEMAWMYEMKYSTGWAEPSGKPTYRPLEPLSREAMAAFIYRLEASKDAKVKAYEAPKASMLADMKPGVKFYKEISWMYDSSLSTGNTVGNTKEYWPKADLSRQAMAAFIYRLVNTSRK